MFLLVELLHALQGLDWDQGSDKVPLVLLFFNVCSTLAYVSLADISRLQDFQQQTVVVVKAPEETKLEVPAPKEVKA